MSVYLLLLMQITADVIAAFLSDLAQHGKLERAARGVGLPRQSIYRHMNAHPEFKAEVRRVQGEARGKPKTAAQLTREACRSVLEDPEATNHAKMNAAQELRKIDAEERRQREARGELGGGDHTKPDEPPPVDEATARLIKEADVRAMVSVLATTVYMLPLRAVADEWRAYAAMSPEDRQACLQHARNPVPLVPADAEAAAIAEPPEPAPAVVIDAIQAIIDGAAVHAVLAELCRGSGFQAQPDEGEDEAGEAQ